MIHAEVIDMNAITDSKKFVTIDELKNLGFSYYKLGRLEEDGLLHRVNRTTYENLSYKGDENDFSVLKPLSATGLYV